jgi:hypothetical protein
MYFWLSAMDRLKLDGVHGLLMVVIGLLCWMAYELISFFSLLDFDDELFHFCPIVI